MTRYIDAEALMKAIRRGGDFTRADLLCILDDIPTADVEEVRHGEWLPSKYHYGFYVCSECGRHIEARRDDPEVPYHYCHCGAKMDGGKKK